MQPAQRTHDQGQSSKHESTEIERVIQNYNIIVDRVNLIDSCGGDKARRLLHTIFSCYIPKIENSISSLQENIHEEDEKRIQTEIEKLKALKKSKHDTTPVQESQGRESHESPLVLLLSLAIEFGTISASDPRETVNESEFQKTGGQNSGGQNWGRLTGFVDYLEQLDFKSHTKQGKAMSKYWPGLPYCVMALVPFDDSHQQEFKISVSASPDRFDYTATEDLQTLIFQKRTKRLQTLESLCSYNEKTQINSARNYSSIIKDWDKQKERKTDDLNKKQKADCDPVNKMKEELYLQLKALEQAQKEEREKLQVRKREKDEELKKKIESHNRKLKMVDDEEPPEAIDVTVPVYLPVIMSTWLPDGLYLPTCFLDCRRFHFIRPLGAEKEESLYSSKKRGPIYPETACAEWDGFINWMSQCRAHDKTVVLPGVQVALPPPAQQV